MRTSLTLAFSALLVVMPVGARAEQGDDAEITRMAKEHYKLGLDAFKAGKYPDAIKELKKAYLLKRLPVLLINIGKTYEMMGDYDNAIYYFQKYLSEAPPDAKDRAAIKQALAGVEAQKNAKPAVPEAPPEAPPPTRRRATAEAEPPPAPSPTPSQSRAAQSTGVGSDEWSHTPIDTAPPSMPVDVRVQMPVMRGVKVYLYYRGKGQTEFTQVLMKRRGSEKLARIPAEQMTGQSIQYYIEAKDATGNVVKNAGSQADPNIVMIEAGAAPQVATREAASPDGPAGEGAPDVVEEAAEARKLDEEAAPITEEQRFGRKGMLFGLGGLGVGGLVLGAVGLVAAGVGAGVGYYYSGLFAQGVAADAYIDGVTNDHPRYVFNAPDLAPNSLQYQDRGHTADIAAGVSIGIGAAMFVAGAALVVWDYVEHHPRAKPKRHRRVRPVDEYQGQAPRPQASLRSLGFSF